jgi:hypothetical protein
MHKLYRTIGQSDPLQFWANHGIDYQRVANFLDLDKNALSRVGGVSVSSVRLDRKIPKQLAERMQQIANICSKVADYFDGDARKTALWFQTPNPMLGYVAPRDMIRLGRYDRLLRFVLEAEEENAAYDEEALTEA